MILTECPSCHGWIELIAGDSATTTTFGEHRRENLITAITRTDCPIQAGMDVTATISRLELAEILSQLTHFNPDSPIRVTYRPTG